ncbi:MAG: glycine--tRNA ligase [Candidatus Aenigmarchaeota archaeon]|nr:glycine--tRNA ligase [Candidatus Aenigmarchaeota archaeon]
MHGITADKSENTDKTAKIEEIARRRGFFWMGSEIYNGLSGFYDYGHLGTLMKRKWENTWRDYFLGLDDNFFEIEPTDIMHEKVFIGSGHVKCFVDPVVKCKKCGNIERADHILEDILKENFEGLNPEALSELMKKHKIKCEKCKGLLEEVKTFNMLFPLDIGVEKPQKAYLRGETAQGVYVNFARAFEQLRKHLPMGLAIVGKAFRNEISPRNLLIRMRELTQAELQIFFDPDKINQHPNFKEVEDYKLRLFIAENRKNENIIEVSCKELKGKLPEFYIYHMAVVQKFYLDVLKIPKEFFRFRELSQEEKAFYNKYHWDVELKLSIGWKEVGGVHYRTDHDLSGHQKISKNDMSVNIDGKKILPHVLELSLGVDRNIFALLDLFYEEEGKEKRIVFRFPRHLAPCDCAVFPLVSKQGLPEKAEEVKKLLQSVKFSVFYDASGSIGRRYRRVDEIGIPAAVTIDHQTFEDGTVTVRDRDSMKQERVAINKLPEFLAEFLRGREL